MTTDAIAIIVSVITLALSSPIFLDRYIYKPRVRWRSSEPAITQGKVQLNWSAKNFGSRSATNIRVAIMTPEPDKTEVITLVRVPAIVSRNSGVVLVDIPYLPPGEVAAASFQLPPELWPAADGVHKYVFAVGVVTGDNSTPEPDAATGFTFFRPDAH